MRVTGARERRGPNSTYVYWPSLGHDLHNLAGPRGQAHAFVASNGRRWPSDAMMAD